MRYLALDLGDRRTGLALGDRQTRVISPLPPIEVPLAARDGSDLIEAIARAVGDAVGGSPATIVMGLPLNMDGTEGPRARITRAFAQRLSARLHRPIMLHDERLTSSDAEWTLAGSGLTHGQKKQRRDGLAAAALLSDFLASLGPIDASPAPGWT
ncbi:MAG: Holliday junction resolvase RuvX [Phycisphaerae bacterium]|nr:Holliday junction resolvase RuvX [Phycisphaerae bacterium]